jgi:hypothetical protein
MQAQSNVPQKKGGLMVVVHTHWNRLDMHFAFDDSCCCYFLLVSEIGSSWSPQCGLKANQASHRTHRRVVQFRIELYIKFGVCGLGEREMKDTRNTHRNLRRQLKG